MFEGNHKFPNPDLSGGCPYEALNVQLRKSYHIKNLHAKKWFSLTYSNSPLTVQISTARKLLFTFLGTLVYNESHAAAK